jgi:hypothetical protein
MMEGKKEMLRGEISEADIEKESLAVSQLEEVVGGSEGAIARIDVVGRPYNRAGTDDNTPLGQSAEGILTMISDVTDNLEAKAKLKY